MRIRLYVCVFMVLSAFICAQEAPYFADDQRTPIPGFSSENVFTEQVQAVTGFWYPPSTFPSLPNPTYFQAAAWLGDTLYVHTPVLSGTTLTASAIIVKYTLNGAWTLGTPLPTSKVGGALTACGGKLYFTGGGASSVSTPSTDVYEYAPSTGAWVTKAPLPAALASHGAVSWGDSVIFTVGGPYTGPTTTIYAYRPNADVWFTSTALPTGAQRRTAAVAISGNKIIVAGGYTGSAFSKTLYVGTIGSDATQITWTAGPNIPTTYTGLSRPGGAAYGNYFFTICGERGGLGGYYDTLHVFDINALSWVGIISGKSIKVSNIFNACTARNFNDTIKVFVPGGYGSASGLAADAAGQSIFEVAAVVTGGSGQICRNVPVNTDWNMLSVPVKAANMHYATLFPGATTPPYRYNGGYIAGDTLQNSLGYWLRFSQAQTYNICGNAVGLTAVPVAQGWNMIGVYESNIPVSAITTTPSGIVNSPYYGYQSGYTSADTLKFGKGYWVRTTQAGTLNIPAQLAKAPVAQLINNESKAAWAKIFITDAAGRAKTLYLKNDNANLSRYDLPPLPPAGVFDVRFSGNRDVENIAGPGLEIVLQSAEYPVTLKSENADVRIKDCIDGRFVNQQLKDGESFVISNSAVARLSVAGNILPVKFVLEQNYPNPFNPSTKIAFQIPSAGKVTIKLYDALGRQAGTLLNESREAGRYVIELNAARLSSGIYFYELSCGDFHAVKKLSVLK